MKVFFMEFRMYWIVNHSLDPTFNLALEEYFLGRIEPGHPGYAILWQNSRPSWWGGSRTPVRK